MLDIHSSIKLKDELLSILQADYGYDVHTKQCRGSLGSRKIDDGDLKEILTLDAVGIVKLFCLRALGYDIGTYWREAVYSLRVYFLSTAELEAITNPNILQAFDENPDAFRSFVSAIADKLEDDTVSLRSTSSFINWLHNRLLVTRIGVAVLFNVEIK